MTCSAEFPCYSTIANAVERAVRESTIPAPPPEDDGGTLHTMTLDDARQTIDVLREQGHEQLAGLSAALAKIARLEALVSELTSEKR